MRTFFIPGISRRETAPHSLKPDTGYGLNEYRAALGLWLPGRKVNGLFFGYPSAGNNRVGENEWVASQIAAHPEMPLSRKIALVSPADGEEATRRLVKEQGFIGIKPYRLYAPVEDTRHARIEEFAPALDVADLP